MLLSFGLALRDGRELAGWVGLFGAQKLVVGDAAEQISTDPLALRTWPPFVFYWQTPMCVCFNTTKWFLIWFLNWSLLFTGNLIFFYSLPD